MKKRYTITREAAIAAINSANLTTGQVFARPDNDEDKLMQCQVCAIGSIIRAKLGGACGFYTAKSLIDNAFNNGRINGDLYASSENMKFKLKEYRKNHWWLSYISIYFENQYELNRDIEVVRKKTVRFIARNCPKVIIFYL